MLLEEEGRRVGSETADMDGRTDAHCVTAAGGIDISSAVPPLSLLSPAADSFSA